MTCPTDFDDRRPCILGGTCAICEQPRRQLKMATRDYCEQCALLMRMLADSYRNDNRLKADRANPATRADIERDYNKQAQRIHNETGGVFGWRDTQPLPVRSD